MGTINYGTSAIITLGCNPNLYEDNVIEDRDGNIYKCERWEMMEEDREEVRITLEDHDILYNEREERKGFYNKGFKVAVEYGYYEGFYLVIHAYTEDEDDKEIKADEAQLYNALSECLDRVPNLAVCYPGWAMHYEDNYEMKMRLLDEAIKKWERGE